MLVDRLNALDPRTREGFRRFGWHVRAEIAEAAEWLRQARPRPAQTIVSNLFFHQFQSAAARRDAPAGRRFLAAGHRARTAALVAGRGFAAGCCG